MIERPRFGRALVLRLVLASLPLVAVASWLASGPGVQPVLAITLVGIAVAVWIFGVVTARRAAIDPLRTLASLLGGLRRGDYSMRSARARPDDALGLVMLEANALADTLTEQRIGALEATALLRKVMSEIEVAVFAFDEHEQLRLVNRAGERLLGRPRERIEHESAEALGLAELLRGPSPRLVELSFAGIEGRGELRRTAFRQHGQPHVLLVLADLSQALRQEELSAWRSLVRVLSHEINNSLAPIASVAGSMRRLLDREPAPADRDDDLRGALELIESRASALGRFMAAYARLARLPPPELVDLEIGGLVTRVASLERRAAVTLEPGPELIVRADRDQLEQVLINLVANAVDASSAGDGGKVVVGWSRDGRSACVRVRDEGPGLADTDNLFVPFFSTKPGGSGIGLVLSRRIAESHGGSLSLRNRDDGRGAEAVVRLPLP
ncbi:MAG: PAS domain-containing sensor histidine kinase [Deltaproteobacteria bacterium]|nr:PAS domain-containing sensor histidine kinase [Nannocystaceae bacterium]